MVIIIDVENSTFYFSTNAIVMGFLFGIMSFCGWKMNLGLDSHACPLYSVCFYVNCGSFDCYCLSLGNVGSS